jgi:hypothetical protein
LKDLEKDLEALHKEEDKELKSIDKYKREIEKAEDVIKVKKNEQDLKQKEITAQKEKMIGVSLNADEKKLQDLIDIKASFETFFNEATLNPNAGLIKGVICGYRIEEIENPVTRQVRYMDKLVDDLANGKKMEKILRVG